MSSAALKIVNDPSQRISGRTSFPMNMQSLPPGGGLVPGKIHQVYGAKRSGKSDMVLGQNIFGGIMDESNFMGPELQLQPGTKVCWNSPKHGRLTGVIAFTSPKRGSYYNLRLDVGLERPARRVETLPVDSYCSLGEDPADLEPVFLDLPRSITYAVQALASQVRRLDAIELLGALS